MMNWKQVFLGLGLVLILAACPTADTTPPTISLSSNLSNVTAAGSITLTATASDDTGITKVEFYEGVTKLGEDSTAPFEQTIAFTIANNGTKTYTAKAFDAATNSSSSSAVNVVVNIPEPVSKIEITPSVTSLAIGQTLQLNAVAKNSSGVAVTPQPTFVWAVDNSNLGVSNSGLATGLIVGDSKITASVGNISGTAMVKIVQNIPTIASITVSPIAASIFVGTTKQFTAIAKDANGIPLAVQPNFNWISLDSASQTTSAGVSTRAVNVTGHTSVTNTGLVSALSVGNSIITAESTGVSANALVQVVAVPTIASIEVLPKTASVSVGTTRQFTATAKDASGTALSVQPTFTWTSSSVGNATVSTSGLASGVAVGSSIISASAGGFTGGATLSVTAAIPTLMLSSSSNLVTTPSSITITATPVNVTGIAKVEFFDGATKIGEDSTAPYEKVISLTAADNGVKLFVARAVDSANAVLAVSTSFGFGFGVTVNIGSGVATAVTGKITNWAANTTGVVSFFGVTAGAVNFALIGSSDIDTNGNFNASFVPPLPGVLTKQPAGTYSPAPNCNINYSNTINYVQVAFGLIFNSNNFNIYTGFITLSNNNISFDQLFTNSNVPIGTKLVSFYYSDAPATITGTCVTTYSGITSTTVYNVTLKAGWNYLISNVTAANSTTITKSDTIPSDVNWYYSVPTAPSVAPIMPIR
jgi:hypothetical protein